MLVVGWLVVVGRSLVVGCCRLLVVGCRLFVVSCRLLVCCCRLLVVGCRLLVGCCRLLVGSCRLVGCRLLVAVGFLCRSHRKGDNGNSCHLSRVCLLISQMFAVKQPNFPKSATQRIP